VIRRLKGPQARAIVDSLGSSVLIQTFVLVSGIAAARLLGPSDRGNLALIWTVALTVSQLGSLGLPLAVTHEIAGERLTPWQSVRGLARPVAAQLTVVVGVHAAAIALLVGLSSVPAGAAWVSLLVMPAMLTQMFALAIVQGGRWFRALNLLRLVPLASYAAALLCIAVLDVPSLLLVTACWVGSYVLAAVVTVEVVRRLVGPRPDASSRNLDVRNMRRFGLRSLLGWASPTETFRIDQLIVGLVLSTHSLGLYVAALAFTNFPRFIAQGVGLVAYPTVSRATDSAEVKRAVLRFVGVGSAISFVACGILAMAAQPLISLAFGSAFESAAGPLRVLLLATALLCVRRVLSDAVRGAGFEAAGSHAEMMSWVVLVPGFLIFAPPFGLYGVASVLVSAYAISLLVLGVLARRGISDGAGPRSSGRRASAGHSVTTS
jgi:PST family polysaccharide transporter